MLSENLNTGSELNPLVLATTQAWKNMNSPPPPSIYMVQNVLCLNNMSMSVTFKDVKQHLTCFVELNIDLSTSAL